MKRSPTPRMRKVNEMLREVIAEAVVELKDPRIGFLTITGVDTAPDLRTARVYYSVLGSEEERRDTQAALESAAPRLQSMMRDRVRLKYLPRLRFLVDEAVLRGTRIEELLRNIQEEKHERDDVAGD